MSKPNAAMVAALVMARQGSGRVERTPLATLRQLIAADLVEPLDFDDHGVPRRVELNIRGQDVADQAIAMGKGVRA